MYRRVCDVLVRLVQPSVGALASVAVQLRGTSHAALRIFACA